MAQTGIGLHTARTLAGMGADVLCTGRPPPGLPRAATAGYRGQGESDHTSSTVRKAGVVVWAVRVVRRAAVSAMQMALARCR